MLGISSPLLSSHNTVISMLEWFCGCSLQSPGL